MSFEVWRGFFFFPFFSCLLISLIWVYYSCFFSTAIAFAVALTVLYGFTTVVFLFCLVLTAIAFAVALSTLQHVHICVCSTCLQNLCNRRKHLLCSGFFLWWIIERKKKKKSKKPFWLVEFTTSDLLDRWAVHAGIIFFLFFFCWGLPPAMG